MTHPHCPAPVVRRQVVVALPLAALVLTLLGGASTRVHAQDPSPDKVPSKAVPDAPPAEARSRTDLPTRNVRVTVTLTDQLGTARPIVRTAVLTIADGRQGLLRSVTRGLSPLPAGISLTPQESVALPLSVDARVDVTPSNKVLLRLGFNYHVFGPGGSSDTQFQVRERELSENLALLVQPGELVTASESADAVSDRKVKVEVQADILP